MDDINVKVHEDMGNVSERFYGFTARQWIFGILTALVVVPLYIYGRQVLGENIAQILVIIIGGPILVIGFVPIQGLKAEKIIPYWWRNYMAFHEPLEYKTEAELEFEKSSGKKKKKKAKAKKKKVNKKADSIEPVNSLQDKDYFDIMVTPDIVRMEDSVSCLIRIPNSNGQYIYLEKSKLIRMGQDLLLGRIFQKDGEIFTYDKDGKFVGTTEYSILKNSFKEF